MEYNFIKNVHEEPQALRATAAGSAQHIKEICGRLKERKFDLILLTGCGSSNNAAYCAEYAFNMHVGIPAKVMPSSEIVLYPEGFLNSGKLVVVISRSGEKGDSLGAARKAKAEGATVIAVTAGRESLLAKTSDEVILTFEGPEHSQPKTKSVLTAIEVLIMLAVELSDSSLKGRLPAAIDQAAEAIGDVFAAYENPIREIAEEYKNQTDIMLTGAGVHYGTAIEAALKLKETCNIHAEAMSTGEFIQGPLLVLNEKWFYIAFVSGVGSGHALKMLKAAKMMKAVTIVLTPEPGNVTADADYIIGMPALDSDIFEPLVYLAPLHLLTYYLSQVRGLDADNPKDFDLILDLILEPGSTEPEMAKGK